MKIRYVSNNKFELTEIEVSKGEEKLLSILLNKKIRKNRKYNWHDIVRFLNQILRLFPFLFIEHIFK